MGNICFKQLSHAMPGSSNVQEPEIGCEFIIEVDSIFFVCLLCDVTKKGSELKSHLDSYEHKFAFLVRTVNKLITNVVKNL